MINGFFQDLAAAKPAEQLVKDQLEKLMPEYRFEDVSNDRYYFHKGDIKAIDEDGKEIMIEVKNDSRIADTGNILCEEKNYFFNSGEMVKGNFYSDYEIYSIVSKRERKIYFLDFSILQKIYKNYRQIEIKHPEQISFVYLLPLKEAIKYGALISTIEF